MENLMIFILATAGLAWILCKSKLFRSWREFLSKKNKEAKTNNLFWWFLDAIHTCHGCMGLWAGLIVYGMVFFGIQIGLYAFTGTIGSVFIISLCQKIERP